MADVIDAFVEERLRLTLTGSISGQEMDSFIPTISQLFKKLRPDATPKDIFISVSEPSVCTGQYCPCKSRDCRLDKYKITIFIGRREQGRSVTKPWVRAYSTDGFSDVVARLTVQANELIARANEGHSSQAKAIEDSDTCSVEILPEECDRM